MLHNVALDFPWLATVLSAVAAFLLGTLWYSPRVMGIRWIEGRGRSAAQIRPDSNLYIYSFLLWILCAAFYSFIAGFLEASTVADYISLASLLWVAFAMPANLLGALYTGYPFKAAAIDTAYLLAGYYLLAAVHIGLAAAGV